MEKWRQCRVPEECIADIYDGAVWKEHSEYLAKPRALALMINLDWFQPFDHTTDSVSVLYTVIQNLPGHQQFKKENVLLGILPVLECEPTHVDTFIQTVAYELKKLKEGLRMYTSDSPRFKVTVKAMVLCAANDILAARKLCGFKGQQSWLFSMPQVVSWCCGILFWTQPTQLA